MRWFIAGAGALVVSWAVFLASPFLAARDLATALEDRDLGRIEARVNFRALRTSLARGLVTDALAQKAALDIAGGSDAQVAASVAAIAAEPLLGEVVTPSGLANLVRAVRAEAGPARPADDGPADGPDLGIRRLDAVPALLRSARWRGFRTLYLTLPPQATPNRQVRLQLRLSRLSWRLVALELLPETRTRLLEELVGRRGAARRAG